MVYFWLSAKRLSRLLSYPDKWKKASNTRYPINKAAACCELPQFLYTRCFYVVWHHRDEQSGLSKHCSPDSPKSTLKIADYIVNMLGADGQADGVRFDAGSE